MSRCAPSSTCGGNAARPAGPSSCWRRTGGERGDATLLAEQTARLHRLAHRLVWVNPHRGKDGFAPVTAGMSAALPHLDELLAGHTLDALHTLADVIADA